MYLEISDPADYHVALYIRLSKEDENEGPSGSVTNQQNMLNEIAAQYRLSVYDTYIDDGFSGTRFDRPAFNRMIRDIEAKKVNMVLTKDLSRLGRDYIMTGHYVEQYFPEHRVRYIAVLDGVDTGRETSANDITPFRAIMNDMFAKDTSKKITAVKRAKQHRGEFIGGKPMFGYQMHPTEKNKIVIDPEAAPIVQRIFAMALDGMSCRKIANQLNRDGVPTPSTYAHLTVGNAGPYTGLWSSQRISDLLRNETYIGNMVQGRTVKVSYKSKKSLHQRPEDWIIVEGTHAPLVSKTAFAQVQMLLNSRRYTRSRTYDFLLKGLIYCHECGYPLTVANRKNRRGEDVLYLVCRTYQRFTKDKVCTCHCIKVDTVTDVVLAKVEQTCQAYLQPDKLLPTAEEALKRAQAAESVNAEWKAIEGKLQKLTDQLDTIYMDRLNGVIAEADFQRIYQKTCQERDWLEQRRAELEAQKKSPVRTEDRARKLVEQYVHSACTSRTLLVNLIDRIELTEKKEIIIKFRFAHPQGLV